MALAKRSFLVARIVLFMAVVVWGIFSPLSTPRIPFNQRRAIESITALALAERNYAARPPHSWYACEVSELGDQGLVDEVLATGTRAGYHFAIRCLQSRGQKAESFTITAVPVSLGITGKYAFCADQSGEVWYSENGLASDCLAMRR